MGNNYIDEESTDLIVLDSKEIVEQAAVEIIRNFKALGQCLF